MGDLLAPEIDLPALPQHQTRPARSWLGVPLVFQGRAVGVITVQSFRAREFDALDERFLSAVAQQTVLMLENSRRFAESEGRAREQALVNEIGLEINGTLELAEIQKRAVRAISDQLGYPLVRLYMRKGDGLEEATAVGDQEAGSVFRGGADMMGRVARTEQAAVLSRAQRRADNPATKANRGPLAAVAIPGSRGSLGVLAVEGHFAEILSERDLGLLGWLAGQLGAALSNAEAYGAALAQTQVAAGPN